MVAQYEHGRCLPHWKRNKNTLVMKRPKFKVGVVCIRVLLVQSDRATRAWKRPSPLETTKIQGAPKKTWQCVWIRQLQLLTHCQKQKKFPTESKARWIVPPGVRSVPCLCVHETWCTEEGPCTLGNWGSCWASGPSWIPRGTAKKKAARSCALWHTAASDSPANLLRYSPHGWRAANLRPETESASESSNKFPNGFWSWEPGESEVYAKSAFNFSTV